jgi:hypothetical protein
MQGLFAVRGTAIRIAGGRTRVLLILFVIHHPLHKRDVVVLGKVSIFEKIGALVFWHGFEEVTDEIIRDERMSQVQFGDIRLSKLLVSTSRDSGMTGKRDDGRQKVGLWDY